MSRKYYLKLITSTFEADYMLWIPTLEKRKFKTQMAQSQPRTIPVLTLPRYFCSCMESSEGSFFDLSRYPVKKLPLVEDPLVDNYYRQLLNQNQN